MAQSSGTKEPRRAQAAKPGAKSAPVAANDQDELKVDDLTRAILARELRPRTGDIRRLAEAVLAKKSKKARKDKAGGKKSKKLAKIPGQKKK